MIGETQTDWLKGWIKFIDEGYDNVLNNGAAH